MFLNDIIKFIVYMMVFFTFAGSMVLAGMWVASRASSEEHISTEAALELSKEYQHVIAKVRAENDSLARALELCVYGVE